MFGGHPGRATTLHVPQLGINGGQTPRTDNPAAQTRQMPQAVREHLQALRDEFEAAHAARLAALKAAGWW